MYDAKKNSMPFAEEETFVYQPISYFELDAERKQRTEETIAHDKPKRRSTLGGDLSLQSISLGIKERMRKRTKEKQLYRCKSLDGFESDRKTDKTNINLSFNEQILRTYTNDMLRNRREKSSTLSSFDGSFSSIKEEDNGSDNCLDNIDSDSSHDENDNSRSCIDRYAAETKRYLEKNKRPQSCVHLKFENDKLSRSQILNRPNSFSGQSSLSSTPEKQIDILHEFQSKRHQKGFRRNSINLWVETLL